MTQQPRTPTTGAGRALLDDIREVIDGEWSWKDEHEQHYGQMVTAIEAEAAEQEHRRLARLGAERTTPQKQAAALRQYNPEIVLAIEADLLAQIEKAPAICGSICPAGPNGEPLACAYPPNPPDELMHEHSWATLPTFTVDAFARTLPYWREGNEGICRQDAAHILAAIRSAAPVEPTFGKDLAPCKTPR